jgi:hypothetical protein
MVEDYAEDCAEQYAEKCANRWCRATRDDDEGKLFRFDLDLGNRAGGNELITEYIWLCTRCAELMHPKVEVSGDTVTLRLTNNLSANLPAVTATDASAAWIH